MSICKHASSAAEFPFPPSVKTGDLMFQNIFSSMIMVTIQVFTGRESANSFLTLFKMGGGGSAKRFLASFPQYL